MFIFLSFPEKYEIYLKLSQCVSKAISELALVESFIFHIPQWPIEVLLAEVLLQTQNPLLAWCHMSQ